MSTVVVFGAGRAASAWAKLVTRSAAVSRIVVASDTDADWDMVRRERRLAQWPSSTTPEKRLVSCGRGSKIPNADLSILASSHHEDVALASRWAASSASPLLVSSRFISARQDSGLRCVGQDIAAQLAVGNPHGTVVQTCLALAPQEVFVLPEKVPVRGISGVVAPLEVLPAASVSLLESMGVALEPAAPGSDPALRTACLGLFARCGALLAGAVSSVHGRNALSLVNLHTHLLHQIDELLASGALRSATGLTTGLTAAETALLLHALVSPNSADYQAGRIIGRYSKIGVGSWKRTVQHLRLVDSIDALIAALEAQQLHCGAPVLHLARHVARCKFFPEHLDVFLSNAHLGSKHNLAWIEGSVEASPLIKAAAESARTNPPDAAPQ